MVVLSTCCLVEFIYLSLFVSHFVVKWFTFMSKFSILLDTLVVIPYAYVLVDLGIHWKSFTFFDLEIRLKIQFNLRIVEIDIKLVYNFNFARIVYLLGYVCGVLMFLFYLPVF